MLAIGIVVDDAIVVVENVERNIENGLSPREATYKAMEEVSGPIIAIALVLVAVFVPIAFITGLTGEFYKQFALTIAISTVISAINSLTLSPALSALLLKRHGAKPDALTRARRSLRVAPPLPTLLPRARGSLSLCPLATDPSPARSGLASLCPLAADSSPARSGLASLRPFALPPSLPPPLVSRRFAAGSEKRPS